MAEVPDLCEPILAWRFWRVSGDSRRLVSGGVGMIGTDVVWEPYERLVAAHFDWGIWTKYISSGISTGISSFAPQLGDLFERRIRCATNGPPCPTHRPIKLPGCGVYGVPEDRLKAESVNWSMGDKALAIGCVALWGRVAVHERGWRGQYAYPQRFVWVSRSVDGSALAAQYGIPYKEDAAWKSVMKKHELLQSLSESLSLPVSYPSPSPPQPAGTWIPSASANPCPFNVVTVGGVVYITTTGGIQQK